MNGIFTRSAGYRAIKYRILILQNDRMALAQQLSVWCRRKKLTWNSTLRKCWQSAAKVTHVLNNFNKNSFLFQRLSTYARTYPCCVVSGTCLRLKVSPHHSVWTMKFHQSTHASKFTSNSNWFVPNLNEIFWTKASALDCRYYVAIPP